MRQCTAYEHLILCMEWCVTAVVWRRQQTDVLRDVDILYFRLTTTAYELNECIMDKAVLILHSRTSTNQFCTYKWTRSSR